MLHSIRMRRNCPCLWPLELPIQISHSPLHSPSLLRNQKYPTTSSSSPAKNSFGTTAIRLQSIFSDQGKGLIASLPLMLPDCQLLLYSYVIGTQFRTSEPESIDPSEVIHLNEERMFLMQPGLGFSHLILLHCRRIARVY